MDCTVSLVKAWPAASLLQPVSQQLGVSRKCVLSVHLQMQSVQRMSPPDVTCMGARCKPVEASPRSSKPSMHELQQAEFCPYHRAHQASRLMPPSPACSP